MHITYLRDKTTQMQRKKKYPNHKKGKLSISWRDKYRNTSEFNVAEVKTGKNLCICSFFYKKKLDQQIGSHSKHFMYVYVENAF